MKPIACCAFALSLALTIVVAQEPSAPVDYVASVKRNTTGGGLIRILPGNISVTGMPAGIVDKTGLTGYYDIALNYTPTPDQIPNGPPPPGAPPLAINPDGTSLVTAIQEQLGLKLQDQRGPVEVLVIDSINQPTEN